MDQYHQFFQKNILFLGKALNNAVVFKIDWRILDELRRIDNSLDKQINDWEKRIQNHGMPFWDYIVSDIRCPDITAKQKVKRAIQRILRILKSYKSSAFEEVLSAAKEKFLKKEIIPRK